MTRRMLDSAIFANEKFGTMPPMARLLAIGIINKADDQGRGKANPIYLRSQIFPYDEVTAAQVSEWLAMVASNETIIVYQVDGKDYYQVLNWWNYQSHQFAVPSQYPKPDGWKDRIRKTLTTGHIITCNWITANGKVSPDTCDEQGLAIQPTIQVNDQVNDQVMAQTNDQVNLQLGVQDKDKDKDYVKEEFSSPKSGDANKPVDQGQSKPRSKRATDPVQQAEPTEPTGEVQPKTPSAQQGMFGAIADVCHVDPMLKKGQIATTSKAMLKAGYTSDQVRDFTKWWKANDFRGKQGQVPTIGQLTENMRKFVESATPKNGTDPAKPKTVLTRDFVTDELKEVPA